MAAEYESNHRCSVLVVDDDPSTGELLTIALQDDYLVAAVANGRQALHYLRSHAETCIILLELRLPVMDGRQFRTVQLRDRSLAWIPVIVISAVADVEQRARELGARCFVRKPINLDELRHAVKRVGCCPAGRLRTGLQRIPAMR